MKKLFAFIPAVCLSTMLTGCAVVSNSMTTDADLLARAGKALSTNPNSLKLRTRSMTTSTVTWQVEDTSLTRYNCEYLSLGVVDDEGTTCKEVERTVVTWSCPKGYKKGRPGFSVCEIDYSPDLSDYDPNKERVIYKEELQQMGYWKESYE